MSHSNADATIETVQALVSAYGQGRRSFSGITLTEAVLTQADLKGADLSYADLAEADLSHANLRGADLSYAVLRGANLTSADLRGAMLIGTDLRETQLHNAQLTDADYDPLETRFPAGFDPDAARMKRDR